MKKLTLFGLSALLLIAFISSSALAGAGCGALKASADKAKVVDCKVMSPEECLKLYGISPEECKKMCADHANCGFTKMSVKGMTCGSCESQVTSALSKVEGVNKVIKVDHKEGFALVCCDPAKIDNKMLTAAVINTGYQAEIIPAVAKTDSPIATPQITTGMAGCSKSCAKTCGPKAKAACLGHPTGDKTEKTETKSDES